VQVEAFYIGVYQVTQVLWKSVMGEGNNPSRFLGDNRPVEQVSWFDCQDFIKQLNILTKSKRITNGMGAYRLPTEAEWEYAACGGNLNARYKYAGSDKLKEVGWFGDNSAKETLEVGKLLPNSLGLFDMSGNVSEWVEDHWHDSYLNAPKDVRVWLTGEILNRRVLRGGSNFLNARECRITARAGNPPGYRFDDFGFRLAMTI
jgi:formylglycine-generating enzyme required for sulfatase activity